MVGWIKMKFGMEVGLVTGHIVLDGDPAPPKRGTALNFRPMSIVAVAKRSPISAIAELLFVVFVASDNKEEQELSSS